MKAIKNIAILKPIIVYDASQDIHYLSKKGCMIVEYEDNTRNELDLQNMVDLTDSFYWEYKLMDKTKIKYLFKSEV